MQSWKKNELLYTKKNLYKYNWYVIVKTNINTINYFLLAESIYIYLKNICKNIKPIKWQYNKYNQPLSISKNK